MKFHIHIRLVVLTRLFILLVAGFSGRALAADTSVAASTPTSDAPAVATSTAVPEPQTIHVETETPLVVSAITFEGNTLNKSKSLERKLKSKVGQTLDRKTIQADIKILFETGYFDDVTADITRLGTKDAKKRERARVTFTVVERPTIKRIDYKGNIKIRSSSFSDKVQSKEEEPYDKYKASLDERVILEYYRDEGYAQARVEHYTTPDAKKKQLLLTFFIIEGERVMVKSLSISGSQRFTEKKLISKMKTRRKKVFKEDVLRSDRQALIDFYRNHGHLDAEISTPTVNVDLEHNVATIAMTVTEGAEYKVGTFRFYGATIFSEKELRKAVVLKSGKEYEQSKLDESVTNISGMYADKGYLRTEVNAEPVRDQAHGLVNFTMDIHESPVVYVDGVYVDGNTYTKEKVIKREVLLKPGDVFAASRMRRSVERIYNLGFLEDVNVDVQQPRDPNLADLIFTVKEGKPGVFSVGAGFSSVDRFVGTLQLQHTNLFGLGQRADVSYEFGSRRQNFQISWTDPWLFDYNMSGGVDLFNTVQVRDYPGIRSAFEEKRRGVSFRLGPRLSEDTSLLFNYTVQNTEVYGVDASIKQDLFPTFGVPKSLALETDSVSQLKSSFLTELSRDTRDNKFDATRGGRGAISVETAGGPFGGDVNYYKPQLLGSYYIPTFWKFVFSASARIAWVNAFSPTADVPSSERFYLGGPDTVRGYDNNSIVARQYSTNDAGVQQVSQLPGVILSLFNLEYKFPIVQEKNKTIFQGAFFADIGGTWLRAGDIDFTTGALDNRMKAGVGFGFRFKTPVFPIRLDFGIPLTPRSTDTTRQGDSHGIQPYFTIGNIF